MENNPEEQNKKAPEAPLGVMDVAEILKAFAPIIASAKAQEHPKDNVCRSCLYCNNISGVSFETGIGHIRCILNKWDSVLPHQIRDMRVKFRTAESCDDYTYDK